MFKNKLVPAYILLVGLPLLILFGVLQSGRGLTAPNPAVLLRQSAPPVVPPAVLNLFQLVMQIGVILLVSRIVGMLFKKIKQPQVIGEMVAGILLGPSLLGWVAPGLSSALFPAASMGYLSALSQVGL